MKWNWGTKLFIWTAAFMIMLIVFAALMMREEISLVEPDYYPKGQSHQDLIEKRQNALSLSEQINVKVEGGILILQFPEMIEPEYITGEIQLYHIADDTKDKIFLIETDTNGKLYFDVTSLKGRYMLKMDWQYKQSNYYTEKQINIY
ncbi:MAG: FixH family protein [Bacteroidales bacterium]|jgi:hypothetical protein|nr:FixH family protein [Bacteroidales bacterium]